MTISIFRFEAKGLTTAFRKLEPPESISYVLSLVARGNLLQYLAHEVFSFFKEISGLGVLHNLAND